MSGCDNDDDDDRGSAPASVSVLSFFPSVAAEPPFSQLQPALLALPHAAPVAAPWTRHYDLQAWLYRLLMQLAVSDQQGELHDDMTWARTHVAANAATGTPSRNNSSSSSSGAGGGGGSAKGA